MSKQSPYNQEFRDTAVRLALAGDKPMAQIAKELGIDPMAVNYFQPINPICSAIVSWIFCIPIVIFAFKAYMLPADISSETDHPHSGGIFALALLGIVCPLHLTWYVALFMATKFVGKKGKENVQEGDQKSGADEQE